MPMFREPKCCLFCSNKKAVDEYEAKLENSGNYVVENPSKIKNLVLMDRMDELTWKCKSCGAVRPIETEKALWWVTCLRCNKKQLSYKKDKCPTCEVNNLA